MGDSEQTDRMVQRQLERRGIHDARVLEAFRSVPRIDFVPDELAEFAYQDTALPIEHEQTISQPYIVALTLSALELSGQERVLEIGTGSGYAAAVLSRLAKEVFTVERIAELAQSARERLRRLGYDNVHVLCADGTLGWPEHAPYEAIAVAAGGPEVPKALLEQLAPRGRLVIPVGSDDASQTLLCVTRDPSGDFHTESLGGVRFVPLIGEQGFAEAAKARAPRAKSSPTHAVSKLIHETAEPLDALTERSVDRLVERMGGARVVLLGESTHGTSEFYRMRARISQALIERHHFDFVAVEADWPDAMAANRYVANVKTPQAVAFTPFSRFPTWMWRNEETRAFLSWLRAHNEARKAHRPVGFYGLDLYSMFTSIAHVVAYLDSVDPDAARVARSRYGTLTPWQKDPAAYGKAVLSGRYASSEATVVNMLRDLLQKRIDYAERDGERFFDASQNARVVANAESYYRTMYYGAAASWNLRDIHMFETLQSLRTFHGAGARAIVWAHNSHLGNARATEMNVRGELNVGELCRDEFGPLAYAVGFGTDHGTVAAASDWDAPMERMAIRPSLDESYERLCHDTNLPAFMLHLREPRRPALREELTTPRLQRAIGVVYRPDTERMSHYFLASLPLQFDEYIWFDATTAVSPTQAVQLPSSGPPETYPFGL